MLLYCKENYYSSVTEGEIMQILKTVNIMNNKEQNFDILRSLQITWLLMEDLL